MGPPVELVVGVSPSATPLAVVRCPPASGVALAAAFCDSAGLRCEAGQLQLPVIPGVWDIYVPA